MRALSLEQGRLGQGRWRVSFKRKLGAKISGSELGAKICGSELGAKARGADVSVQICGAETTAFRAKTLGADPLDP
jgi:hypothetical protein